MSRKNNEQQRLEAIDRNKERARAQKQLIKERIRLSNEMEANGLPPDEWVVNFRKKNNEIKAKWKATQPKSTYVPKVNSGSFKKGMVPIHKHTEEQRAISLAKWRLNTKEWHKKNKERINELARIRRQNPTIKIKCNLRKRLSFLLRKSIVGKTEQTLDLLGISIPDFMEYLKSKFSIGMSFENYGQWHLDHIIPCYYFDLTKESERKTCFHYTNIQPMWAKDNLRKNKRIEDHAKVTRYAASREDGQYHQLKDL